jgi:hypothetical protein
MLERLYGSARAVAKDGVTIAIDGCAHTQDGGKPPLNVRNCGSGVPEGHRQAYRYAEISWSS